MTMSLSARILCGKSISKSLISDIAREVVQIKSSTTFTPTLAILQVGNREDSNMYIRNKVRESMQCGIEIKHVRFSHNVRTNEILECIHSLNNNTSVHGIIMQLPLDSIHSQPTELLLNAVHPNKDVDGLTCYQSAHLSHGEFLQENCSYLTHLPCTPLACLHLIKSTGLSLAGKKCIIVGNGRLVGIPLASLLTWTVGVTVTICHEQTRNLDKEIGQADILVSGVGKPELIKGEWIRLGAVVIDCGINTSIDCTDSTKIKIIGDVKFETAVKRAGWITPVPGGVGPVTVAMLLRNTITSAKYFYGLIKKPNTD